MLADPKSDSLVENFAGQWLETRALDDRGPSAHEFESWDQSLREAMRTETHLYFKEFLQSNIGMDEFLSADFSYLNERLAKHYQIEWKAPPGTGFVRRKLPEAAEVRHDGRHPEPAGQRTKRRDHR